MTSTNGEALEISSERVDDIPVILGLAEQMVITRPIQLITGTPSVVFIYSPTRSR